MHKKAQDPLTPLMSIKRMFFVRNSLSRPNSRYKNNALPKKRYMAMSHIRYRVPSILIKKVSVANNNAAAIMSRIPFGILVSDCSFISICSGDKTGFVVSTLTLSVVDTIHLLVGFFIHQYLSIVLSDLATIF